MATRPVPWDVAIGLIEVAEAKNCLPEKFIDNHFNPDKSGIKNQKGAQFGRGYKSAEDFYDHFYELGKGESTKTFIKNNFERASFENSYKSAEYHLYKHGNGMTLKEYVARARLVFKNPAISKSVDLKVEYHNITGNGAEGLKTISEYGEGVFTLDGRIITFTPKK